MPRQLVVCLDGTGNRFSHTPTNILRLRRAFDSQSVLAYYDQGVGTFGLKETLFEWQKVPARVWGLAFGWGLKRTVQSIYEFLAENYHSDDEIYLLGFSRGAYTARALAALIYACGLVEPHQLNTFDYAWAMLLARKQVATPPLRPSSDAVPAAQPSPKTAPDWSLQRTFKDTFGREISIKFMGLFDTVKSVGWVYDATVIPYTARIQSWKLFGTRNRSTDVAVSSDRIPGAMMQPKERTSSRCGFPGFTPILEVAMNRQKVNSLLLHSAGWPVKRWRAAYISTTSYCLPRCECRMVSPQICSPTCTIP